MSLQRTVDNDPKAADTTNFILAEEYQDFKEFLENELGVDRCKELIEKFESRNL